MKSWLSDRRAAQLSIYIHQQNFSVMKNRVHLFGLTAHFLEKNHTFPAGGGGTAPKQRDRQKYAGLPNALRYRLVSIPVLLLLALSLMRPTDLTGQSCDPLPTFNRTFSNTTVTAPAMFVGENIRITGTVNFNANITMVRCTVLMDPNAVLNINNSTFSLVGNLSGRSVIYGCGFMWQAINVRANAAVRLENSDIRDGIQGVAFFNGFLNGVTQISGCEFSRNLASITALSVQNLTFSTFSGNTFRGISPFDPLLPPYAGGSAVSAIVLANSSGSIGTSGSENLVSRMTTGVRASNNTNIVLNNFRFAYCRLTDPFNGGSGTAIISTSSWLTMQNIFSNDASCFFEGNGKGVVSRNTFGLIVRDARFLNQLASDVEVVNSTNPYHVEIVDNTITLLRPSVGSIAVNRAAQASGVNTRVQSNIITLPSGTGVLPNAVRLVNVTTRPGATDQFVIANNQITCANGNPSGGPARTIDGIYITGTADGYHVSGNIIKYPFAAEPNADIVSVGIGFENVGGINHLVGPNNQVTTNRFGAATNQFRQSWLRCGIHIDGSPNIAVCKNDVDDPRHVYHFTNGTPNFEFGRNVIRDGILGLELHGTVPNAHDYRMNEWVPGSTYNISGARKDGNPNITWLVDGSNGNPLGHLPPSFTPANLFAPQANGQASSTPICDAALPPSGGFGEPPTGEMAETFLGNGYGEMSGAERWDFERDLLEMMIRFPATFEGNTAAEQYYELMADSAVWKFANAERMLHAASSISPSAQNALAQLFGTVTAIADSLSQIELLEGADTTTTNPSWQGQKSALLAQLHSAQGQLQTLSDYIFAQRCANMIAVKAYIQDLPQDSELELNWRGLLSLMAKQACDETWSEADSALLRAVAYSCPADGGKSVRVARAMLPAPESFSFMREGEDPLCEASPRSGHVEAPAALEKFTIWPMPANDVLFAEFERPFEGSVELLDVSGKILRSVKAAPSNKVMVPTSGLPSGAYLLRVTSLSGAKQTKVVTVVR
jgi:hypothetical protein